MTEVCILISTVKYKWMLKPSINLKELNTVSSFGLENLLVSGLKKIVAYKQFSNNYLF